jgi:hypothetical protein
VSSSPALRWFILLLLLLSLGWKLAVRAGDTGELTEKEVQLKVAEFLVRQHFSVAISENVTEGQPNIRATAVACRMLVAKSPAMGWDRDMLRSYETTADHVFVVFRGQVYADQPKWLTVMDSLWYRLVRGLGLKAQPAPVLAVIATASCDAERLPWGELR